MEQSALRNEEEKGASPYEQLLDGMIASDSPVEIESSSDEEASIIIKGCQKRMALLKLIDSWLDEIARLANQVGSMLYVALSMRGMLWIEEHQVQ